MIDEILRLMDEIPFHPFTIVTSAGKQYPVPSVDHISFSPGRKLIGVWHDDDTLSFVSPLRIAAIDGAAPASSAAQ